jgi:hypothetical protein
LSVRLQDSDLVDGRLPIGVLGVGSSAFVDKWVLKAILPGPSLILCHHRCSSSSRCVFVVVMSSVDAPHHSPPATGPTPRRGSTGCVVDSETRSNPPTRLIDMSDLTLNVCGGLDIMRVHSVDITRLPPDQAFKDQSPGGAARLRRKPTTSSIKCSTYKPSVQSMLSSGVSSNSKACGSAVPCFHSQLFRSRDRLTRVCK